ncbi:MAG TPA: hypothetical protein VFB81_10010, partial [Myxococcales bacterium]|nr:hypothetical protein [Myxococcales bacterium]
PGGLVSIDFSIGLGPQGQLGQLNATTTSNVAGTVQAVGEFVVNAVAVAAKIAPGGDTAAIGPEPGVYGFLAKLQQQEPWRLCAVEAQENLDALAVREKDLGQRLAKLAPVAAGASPTPEHKDLEKQHQDVQKQLASATTAVTACECVNERTEKCKEDLPRSAPHAAQLVAGVLGRLNPALEDGANVERLYPLTPRERAVMLAAGQVAGKFASLEGDKFQEGDKFHLKSASEYIEKAKEHGDKAKADVAALNKALGNLDLEALTGAVPSVPGLAEPFKAAKKAYLLVARQRRLAKVFEQAAHLSDDEWRHRHATSLEARIADLEAQMAAQPAPVAALVQKRDQLRRQWALTIRAQSEYERSELLRAFLSSSPAKSVPSLGSGSTQPKMTELVLARQELDALQTSMAQKRAALRPAPTATPQRLPRNIQLAPQWFDAGGASTDAWVAGKAADLRNPEFIVVVEKGTNP